MEISPDGAVIPREFLEKMGTGPHAPPPINSRVVGFQFDGQRFYATTVASTSLFLVSLRAHLHNLDNYTISFTLPTDSDGDTVSGLDLQRSITLLPVDDFLLVYSDIYDFFHIIKLADETADIRNLTWKPLAMPDIDYVAVDTDLQPGENDKTWTYYVRVAYRNELNQSTAATRPRQIRLNTPYDQARSIVGKLFTIQIDGAIPDDVMAMDVYLGDEPYREGLVNTFGPTANSNAPPLNPGDPVENTGLSIASANQHVLRPDIIAPNTDGTKAFYPSLVRFVNGRLFLAKQSSIVHGPVAEPIDPDQIPPDTQRRRQSPQNVIVDPEILQTNLFSFSETTSSGEFTVGDSESTVVGIESVDTAGKLDEVFVFTAGLLHGEDEPQAFDFNPGAVYTGKQAINYDSGAPQLYFSVTDIPNQPGTVAPRSIVNYGNNVYYWAPDGVRAIGSDPSFELSSQVREFVQAVLADPNRNIDIPFGFYHDHKIIWSVPDIANPQNSRALVLDLQDNRRAWTIWHAHITAAKQVFDPVTGTPITGVGTRDGATFVNARFSREYTRNCLPFATHFRSARLRLETAQSTSGYVLNVLFQLYRITGDVDIYLYGQTDTEARILLGQQKLSVRSRTDPGGWGGAMFSNRAWSDIDPAIIEHNAVVNYERVSIEVFDSVQWLEAEIITSGSLRGDDTVPTADDTPNHFSLGEIEVQFLPNLGDISSTVLDQNIYQ